MKLPLTSEQLRALAQFRRALPETRFVLIGAAALKAHIALERATADIDLAMVAEPDNLASLLGPLGWRQDPRMLQRWMHDEGALADSGARGRAHHCTTPSGQAHSLRRRAPQARRQRLQSDGLRRVLRSP